jgi:hypothetical protein
MSNYRDQPWSVRQMAMGDAAERCFEAVCQVGWARFGLNRPPVQVHKLPLMLRYMPDYITTKALVECQGFGRDQVVKLKLEKLLGLQRWMVEHPTEIFLWDSHKKRYGQISVNDITQAVVAKGEIAEFKEGTKYWRIAADDLELTWTKKK